VTISVLNDVEKIRSVDKDGMINFCVDAPKHYRAAADLAKNIIVDFPRQPDNIIVVGMGGSAIGGDIVKDYVRDKLMVPIEVNRDYQLPKYADERTLVLLMSYSGDTEESLGSFLDALRRRCMVYCVTSGGALEKHAKKLGAPYLLVPSGMPPRAALPYMLVPLLVFMEKAGFAKGVTDDLVEALELLEKVCTEYGPDRPVIDNFAKYIAGSIGDSTPVVYGFGVFRAVAQRFKQQFNENSEYPAKWEYFPELNHNEIVGWQTRGELTRYFSVILIRDLDAELLEIQSRIDTTKALMEKAGLIVFELHVQGKNVLAKILSTITIGDFISVYFAVAHGVDPTPVKSIDFLKNTLKQNGVKEEILDGLDELG
jgi:glucose/mannose-6-phosphate isomerase